MKLITRRSRIKDVLSGWRQQYFSNGTWYNEEKEEIHLKLMTLDFDKCSAKDVKDIIGNDSWTKLPACNECEGRSSVIILLGDNCDWQVSFHICPSCLEKASTLIKGHKK